MRRSASFLVFAFLVFASPSANAQAQNESDLANKLSNPVSDLISVPLQFNYDCCAGPKDGDRITLNIQPVVPFHISNDWNLIVRTILPVIDQQETFAGQGDHFGLGDTTQSFFFSPNPAPGGIIWGVGPAFLWPTGTDSTVGSGKWGLGPTLVALKQSHGWTYGILANHIWSYGGQRDRPNISNTFLQPFVGYTWPDTTGITFNTESTYNWESEQWTVPLNLVVSHIYKFGSQPISFQLGARYYASTVSDGSRWGARFAVVFLFPG
ncbi:MAG TPA: hypothetical protein VIM56_04545 [Rhizomicrobium sp.]